MERKGDWIQTFMGIKFWPLDPRPKDVYLRDIAHALALICRYNGHSKCFYSVAEHCVRMARAGLPGDPRMLLMHDAAEAYICDLPRPVKRSICGYREIELNLLLAIWQRFHLPGFDDGVVAYADDVMLATEKRDVISLGASWPGLPEPLPGGIVSWPWEFAESEFLACAENLGIN